MLKLKLKVDFRPAELRLNALLRSTEPGREFRSFLKNALDVELLRRIQTAGDGSWRGWKPRTIFMRRNRLGYYRKQSLMSGRLGVWTGKALKSLFGRGEQGIEVDTPRGFRRISRLKQVLYFNFGTPGGQQQPREWLDERTSPLWLQRAINEFFGRRLAALGTRG